MLALMFPTHLAFGYLAGVYSRFPIVPLIVGSALPDLVDRPLYWLGLTPFTHTVAHSIAVAGPICVLASVLYGRRATALAIGWLAHIAADFLNVLTAQGLSRTPYYVLYLSRMPPGAPEADSAVTIALPVTDITHTLHPVVLLVEALVCCWALAVLVRNGDWKRLQHSDSHRSDSR